MRTVFDDLVFVHYGQIYVESNPDSNLDGFETCWEDQVNGLCGAATPGYLYLVTGTHTGHVRFRVEVHEAEPVLSDEWEDVVEASFRPVSEETDLIQWAGENSWPLSLDEIGYRVRYHAVAMNQADTHDGPAPDRYLLQFWPAAPAPDVILRRTSTQAAYWHKAWGGKRSVS